MKHNKIKKIITILTFFLGCIIVVDLASYIGAGGVLNELDLALEEVENLEKKNLLNNPSGNISGSTEFYLSQYHNSAGIKKHIKEYEAHLSRTSIYSCIFIALFLLSLILRIYFRKGKRKAVPLH
jgi:hypothetical protein